METGSATDFRYNYFPQRGTVYATQNCRQVCKLETVWIYIQQQNNYAYYLKLSFFFLIFYTFSAWQKMCTLIIVS